jgi:hypothetical protein
MTWNIPRRRGLPRAGRSGTVSYLVASALAAAGLIALAAPAPAGPITLSPASYSVSVFSMKAQLTESSNFPLSFPFGIPSQPLGNFGTASNEGMIDSGSSYALNASNTRDEVTATFQISALPNTRTMNNSFGAVIGLLRADTTFQIVVKVKPGAMPPSTLTDVPIIESATGSATCSSPHLGEPGSSATATVVINSSRFPHPLFAGCGPGTPPGIDSTIDLSRIDEWVIGVPVTFEKTVTGTLALEAANGNTSMATFDAMADPSFEIDPSFAFADDFELEFSPGFLSPVSSVPEPASIMLLKCDMSPGL